PFLSRSRSYRRRRRLRCLPPSSPVISLSLGLSLPTAVVYGDASETAAMASAAMVGLGMMVEVCRGSGSYSC
ncbi:hypothetical protein A2U01_0051735, partial [Trifolium medium]|nr:hypothetical protein [Trifolium medium]